MPPNKTSFAADIAPMFDNFAENMAWRMDLTKYEDVKANAQIIWQNIMYTPAQGGTPEQPPNMPPPQYSPLSRDDIATFQQWMNEGCPP